MAFLHTLLLLFVSFQPLALQQDDLLDDISIFLKTANTQELSEHFSSTIQLSLVDEDDTYSKAQAEQVLRSFFGKNKPISAKLVHKLTSNPNYRLAVVVLVTDKGAFRVTYSLKKTGGKYLITEMRFETAGK